MAKPQLIRVPSDSCEVSIGDETYRPHEGEWIEVLPMPQTVRERQAMVKLAIAGKKLQAADGDDDEAEQVNAFLEDDFGVALEIVAKRLVAWNWTDMRGDPLPQPDGKGDLFRELTEQELAWLISACGGKAPDVEAAEEKKDVASSPTTLSATEPQPIRTPSSTARNRMKAS